MRFGISLIGDTDEDWQRYIVGADSAGFWGLGVGDSQSLYPDPYVRLAYAATVTHNLRLATWVTNPVTRHPVVTAQAITTVDRLSGGRAVLGIGTGDSALATIGLRPPAMSRLASYVSTVRALLHDGRAEWEGAALTLVRDATRPAPVYLAASGPRGLQTAGRLADGVIVGTGVGEGIVADSYARIAAGRRAAAADMADPDVWWLLLANLADEDEQAVAEVKNSLASYANLAFRAGFADKHLPVEFRDAVRVLRRQYRALEHAAFDATHHAGLVDRLGLTDYLRRRFALCGTADGVVARIVELHAHGCENIWLNVRVRNKARFLTLWREAVAPKLTELGLWTPAGPTSEGAGGV